MILAGMDLTWLLTSDAGLAVRIAAGVTLLAVMAWIDWRRHGPAARRWREYMFLALAVAVTMAYAVANDMVTVTISPRYFLEHERLAEHPNVRLLAVQVAMKGAWTAGLIIGVAFLLANNPFRRRNWPQLRFGALAGMFRYPLVLAGGLSAALGLAAWSGMFDGAIGLVGAEDLRPLFIVYYVHLGAYLGGAAGTVLGVVMILRRRRSEAQAALMAAPPSPDAI